MTTTKESKIIDNVGDLLKEVGKAVYVFRIEGVMAASPRKDELNKFLKEMDAWTHMRDALDGDFVLIYGLVIDPAAVPYELPEEFKNCSVWVMQEPEAYSTHGSYVSQDDVECFDSIIEAVNYITDCFDREEAEEISEFVIIIGHELEFMIQVLPHNLGVIDYKKLEAGNVQD